MRQAKASQASWQACKMHYGRSHTATPIVHIFMWMIVYNKYMAHVRTSRSVESRLGRPPWQQDTRYQKDTYQNSRQQIPQLSGGVSRLVQQQCLLLYCYTQAQCGLLCSVISPSVFNSNSSLCCWCLRLARFITT